MCMISVDDILFSMWVPQCVIVAVTVQIDEWYGSDIVKSAICLSEDTHC